MSSRAGFRLFQHARFARAWKQQFGQQFGRRTQATDATASGAPAEGVMKRLWNSPVGVKTVHFWAPVMKWSIVLAGISDFFRPAEKLSLQQNLAITATGIIWTRWCFIIKPKNLFLAAVNFFMGCVGVIQVSRIMLWRRSQEGASPVEEKVAEVAGKVEGVVDSAEGAVKDAVK